MSVLKSVMVFFLFITWATVGSQEGYAFGRGPSVMTCQAFDASGEALGKAISFSAGARSSHSIQVTEDGIVYLRWRFHTSPVEVLLQRNPHYPWNLPWTTEDLERGEISLKTDGLIDGEYDLQAIQVRAKLICKQRE